jgi:hypothetical protein
VKLELHPLVTFTPAGGWLASQIGHFTPQYPLNRSPGVPHSWSAQFAENSFTPFRNLTEIPWSSSQQSKQSTLTPLTLDNKFQKIFCICDEYVINLFVCIYEVRKGTQKITWL